MGVLFNAGSKDLGIYTDTQITICLGFLEFCLAEGNHLWSLAACRTRPVKGTGMKVSMLLPL